MSAELLDTISLFKNLYLDHFPLLYRCPLDVKIDFKSQKLTVFLVDRKLNKILSYIPLLLLATGGIFSSSALYIFVQKRVSLFQPQICFWIGFTIVSLCLSITYFLWDVRCPNTACYIVQEIVNLNLALKRDVGEIS